MPPTPWSHRTHTNKTEALAGQGLTTARALAATARLLHSAQPDGGGSFRNAQSHCQACPLHALAHLEPVHQLQGLAVILVGFKDDIS